MSTIENDFDVRTVYGGDDDAMRAAFGRYVQWLAEHADRAKFPKDEDILKLAQSNVGYFGGYFSVERQKQAERVLGAVHPIFGPVGNPQEPKTAREAFAMDLEFVERRLQGRSGQS